MVVDLISDCNNIGCFDFWLQWLGGHLALFSADWHGAITFYPPEITLLMAVALSMALALFQG